ncbi:MAG TPA: 2,3,4,5-tetrahydropyridine-2,6-dicarboxylate N-acetyltransferase, partial [Lactobacillus sp.]|nr:2,3,4,5-tetrahydropyridine-2,6-dicarboxylate N-acetyltransferase [Lactobacillus sp.]
MAELDATEIIQTIATAKKRTPVKAMISGRNLRELSVPEGIEAFMEVHTGTLFG